MYGVKDGFLRLAGLLTAMEKAGDDEAQLATKYRAAFGKGLRAMAEQIEGQNAREDETA